MVPVFQGGDLCGIDGKTDKFHVHLCGSGRTFEMLVFKPHFCEEKGINHTNFVVTVFQGDDLCVKDGNMG